MRPSHRFSQANQLKNYNRKKNFSKDENQNETQLTYDAGSRIETRVIFYYFELIKILYGPVYQLDKLN